MLLQNNPAPDRKSPRLKEYDYSAPGAYFVTVCTHGKAHIRGEIHDGKMYLSSVGEIAENEIKNIGLHYNNVSVDKYVVMPNHIHMIIVISEQSVAEGINPFPTEKHDVSSDYENLVVTTTPNVGNAFTKTAKKYDIPNVIGKFKAAVTRSVGNAFMHSAKSTIWQKSFHDHIIRNKNDYEKIWEYIDTNVVRWELDCFYTK